MKMVAFIRDENTEQNVRLLLVNANIPAEFICTNPIRKTALGGNGHRVLVRDEDFTKASQLLSNVPGLKLTERDKAIIYALNGAFSMLPYVGVLFVLLFILYITGILR